nr:MAG TPA: hypothetical protein [Caudoviricetes sp.]
MLIVEVSYPLQYHTLQRKRATISSVVVGW